MFTAGQARVMRSMFEPGGQRRSLALSTKCKRPTGSGQSSTTTPNCATTTIARENRVMNFRGVKTVYYGARGK